MKAFLYLVILMPFVLFADKKPSLQDDESPWIADCVHPITGKLLIKRKEPIITSSVQPFFFEWFYANIDEKRPKAGWHFLPKTILKIKKDKSDKSAKSIDPNLGILYFKEEPSQHTHLEDFFTLIPTQKVGSIQQTLTSLFPSRFKQANLRVFYTEGKNEKKVSSAILLTQDGVRKIFVPFSKLKKKHGKTYFHLTEEILTNRKKIIYSYDKKNRIEKISVYDNEQKKCYGSAIFSYTNHFDFSILTSDGRIFSFYFEKSSLFPNIFLLKRVSIPGRETEKLFYDEASYGIPEKGKGAFLTDAILQNGQNVHIDYYTVSKNISRHHKTDPYNQETDLLIKTPSDPHFGRVKRVRTNKETSYTLRYHFPDSPLPSGATEIADDAGKKNVIRFSSAYQPLSYEIYSPNNELIKRTEFQYGQNLQENQVLKNEVFDGRGDLKKTWLYAYDAQGNIQEKILQGYLTGKPNDSYHESYRKNYTYSQDFHNLKLSKSEENGKFTQYRYLPKSPLIEAKFAGFDKKILKRSFYFYNDRGVLVKIIEDDGSFPDVNNLTHVTNRKVLEYHLKTSFPALDMPEQIEESYLDIKTLKLILLKKTRLTYGDREKLILEEHFTANGEKIFEEKYRYDIFGRLIEKKDLLHRTASYLYDENGLLIEKKEKNSPLKEIFTYDIAKRLIEKKTIGSSETHFFRYQYNSRGQKTQTDNDHHQIIRKRYDSFGNCIEKIFSEVKNFYQKSYSPSTQATYDYQNDRSTFTNERGFTKIYTRNAYGQKISVEYSDGSKKSYRYTPDGKLYEKILEDETIIRFTKNPWNQLIKKEILSREGEKLFQEEYFYQSDLLIRKKDSNDQSKEYVYDGAKRLVLERSSLGEIKKLSYNDHNLLSEVAYGSENQDLPIYREEYHYDSLERLLTKERFEENRCVSKECYTYDEYDRKILITYLNHGQETKESFTYDDFGRLICTEDIFGKSTTFSYKTKPFLEPFTREILTSDGLLQKECFDANNNLTELSLLDKQSKQPLTTIQFFYDACKNVVLQKYQSTLDEKFSEILEISYEYNYKNLPITKTEQLRGKKRKKIFEYDNRKRLIKKQKADSKNAILYSYDSLNRLKTLSSLDQSISYEYEYWKATNLLTSVKNSINGYSLKRVYNAKNQLVKEILPQNFFIENIYDEKSRLQELKFSDHSKIHYSYSSHGLQTLSRYTKNQSLLYEHEILDSSSWPNNECKENLIFNLGFRTTLKDHYSRPIETSSPYFLHRIEEFSDQGSIKQEKDSLSDHSTYLFDALNQLVFESTSFYTHQYRFDSHYNRIQKDKNLYEGFLLDTRQNAGPTTFEYDTRGNLVSLLQEKTRDQIDYQYDALDRLVKISKKNAWSCEFIYDGLNRKILETFKAFDENISNEQKKLFFIYQNDDEIGSFDENGKIQELKVTLPDPSQKIVALELFDHVYAVEQDLKKNLVALIDPKTKEIVEYHTYDSFGNEKLLDQEKNILPKSKTLSPYGFLGLRREIFTDLVHFPYRFYLAKHGRFLTQDPLDDGKQNPYAFALNNPLKFSDRKGLYPEPLFSQELLVFPKTAKISPFEKKLYPLFQTQSENPKLKFVFINGINNQQKDVLESVSHFLPYLSGKGDVLATHLPSKNAFLDSLACLPLYLGCRTKNVRNFEKILKSQLKRLDSDGFIHLIAHSKGALIAKLALKHLSKKERSHILVYAYGPAAILKKNLGYKVFNIFSKKDPIRFLHPSILLSKKNKSNANINMISHGFGMSSHQHQFLSDPYQNHLFLNLPFEIKKENLSLIE